MSDVLSCEHIEGDCCPSCHDDEAEGYGDLMEVEQQGVTVARVCCAKHDAALERLGLPLPPRVTVAMNTR